AWQEFLNKFGWQAYQCLASGIHFALPHPIASEDRLKTLQQTAKNLLPASPKKKDPGLQSEDRDRFVIEQCGRIKLPHWRRRQD
ncbi:hypothetical protein, partial [Sutterella wadsworthensis]|uniref:hypothetical protein n=1 Tax=Sutterella wadsworthensis TaxID=40545 RepID=UPI00402A76E0